MISELKEYIESQIAQCKQEIYFDGLAFDEGKVRAYRNVLNKIDELFPSYRTNLVPRKYVERLAEDVHALYECNTNPPESIADSRYYTGRADAFAYVGNRLGEILNNGE